MLQGKSNMVTVSTLMAVHNGAHYVKQAIESVLNQTFKEFEFIIVDDASTDATLSILRTFRDKRIRIIRNPKKLGLTASLNIGLNICSGTFIARMDCDDICFRSRLEEQISIMNKDSKLALLGTAAVLIDEKSAEIGIKRYPTDYKTISSVIMRYNPFIHPTIMFRRSVINALGFYDERLDGSEDYDFFLRIVQRHKAMNLYKPLLFYRRSTKSISFAQMKKVEWASLKARKKGLMSYGYPIWQVIYLIKPSLSFLVPTFLKRTILKRYFFLV